MIKTEPKNVKECDMVWDMTPYILDHGYYPCVRSQFLTFRDRKALNCYNLKNKTQVPSNILLPTRRHIVIHLQSHITACLSSKFVDKKYL